MYFLFEAAGIRQISTVVTEGLVLRVFCRPVVVGLGIFNKTVDCPLKVVTEGLVLRVFCRPVVVGLGIFKKNC
ncbi:hypothetical protein DPMN_015452 [Dreissena polymorpha]|uniref:Uncharacterized protein n=1 Tax=Dreissena polymorpha TaxID=45954 RepID=A0A9D4NBK8_DREPO|nr:hypothetical protein DPMN_015452 [Dreissena polymorpha]